MRRWSDLPRIQLSDAPIGTPAQACGQTPPPRVKLRPILAITLLLLTGCYTYAESSLASISPGLQARVRLTEDGFGRVVNQAAMEGVPVEMLDMNNRGLVGRVMEVGTTNMTVQLRGGGGSVFAADVPVQAIREVALRTFSRSRSIAASVCLAVLFTAAYTGFAGGTVTPTPPPEPEQLVLPSTPEIGVGGAPLHSWGRFDVFSARLPFGR